MRAWGRKMRPGRSAWTLAVLALGVGALFLVGWRIDTGGDALSAPSTPIDSAYFAADVASSGPRGRVRREKEDERKEEEEEEERREGEIEREDRETRGAARWKGSWPPSNLEAENGSTIDFGRRKKEESGSRGYDGEERLLDFPWTRNLENEEEGNRVDDSRKISFPWKPEREEDENSDGSRVVGRSRGSFEGEDDRESTSYSVSSSSPLRVDRDSLDPEEEKDGIKDDSSWTSYPVEKSLPLSNLETKERRIEDERGSSRLETEIDRKERTRSRVARRKEGENARRREKKRGTSEDPITKGIDVASSQGSGKRGRGEEDGTRFSTTTDDDGQRTRTGTLNGSSERSSDVEENLSREVNGRSMNEAEKSSGQSYHYLGSANRGHSLTSDARANRGEAEARKAERTGPRPETESESGHHPSNQPRSASTESRGWRRVPWNTNKEQKERVDERSISPSATMDLFFRPDHGSSANTFVSGEGNILEGTRSPTVRFPTIDIRDEKLENDDDDSDDSRLEGSLRFEREESFDEEFPKAEEDLGRESSENLVEEEEKTGRGDEWPRGIVEEFGNAGRKKGWSFRKIDRSRVQKRAGRIRRRRRANYYSQQSATPMAYVHIQPVYPVAQASPPSRKCVQCMVVYKPCPSTPRQPPFPTYKYQELASKWFGLKYGK